MGYIGKNINSRLVCGTLALAAAAPAAAAAPLPAAGHPVHVTAATCDVTMLVDFRGRGSFEATADRANCAGVVLGNVIGSRTVAKVTGKAVRGDLCGWAVRTGRLRLTVTSVNRALAISVPFRTASEAPGAMVSGAAMADREPIAYAGLISLAPQLAMSKSSPPPCRPGAGHAGRLSFQLSLTPEQDWLAP